MDRLRSFYTNLRRQYGFVGSTLILVGAGALVLALLGQLAGGGARPATPTPVATTVAAEPTVAEPTEVPQPTEVPVPTVEPAPTEASADPGLITAAEFGDAWPFTVESGTLRCIAGQAVVFEANGIVYAVNGVAESQGFANVEAIWRDDPAVEGLKVNIGPIIERGRTLCS
jgi:glucose/arabinose dehydrogenase